MSFFFQPTVDSSDDEAPVDLESWRPGSNTVVTSTTRSGRVERIGSSVTSDRVEGIESSGTRTRDRSLSGASTHSLQLIAGTPSQGAPAQTPTGFTSINRSSWLDSVPYTAETHGAPVVRGDFLDSDDDTHAAGVSYSGRLIPSIPHFNGDVSEFVDHTRGGDMVRRIVKSVGPAGRAPNTFLVEFEDYHTSLLSRSQLLPMFNGHEALEDYQQAIEQAPSAPRSRNKPQPLYRDQFVNIADMLSDSDPESAAQAPSRFGQRRSSRQTSDIGLYNENDAEQDDDEVELLSIDSGSDGEIVLQNTRSSGRVVNSKSTRQATRRTSDRRRNREQQDESDEDALLHSDVHRAKRSRPRASAYVSESEQSNPPAKKSKRQRSGMRQSGRSTRHRGDMHEIEVDDIFRSDSDSADRAPVKPKITTTKEIFKPLPRDDEFRMRHIQECEVCGDGPHTFPLIYCQGCCLSYHKSCLGNRTNREHLVTKVGDDDFVLQCRRCVAVAHLKDRSAPDLGKCQDCRQHGISCQPFRSRKTSAQEQKERDENDGDDPIYNVDPLRINKAENVLFRCLGCSRAFHFQHLPSRSNLLDIDLDIDPEQRFREYGRDWKCKECIDAPAKVSTIIAWRPIDEDNYDPTLPFDEINENEKAYLVKWEGMSYFRAAWLPGAWVWGTTAHMMRKAFAKRDDSSYPKMRTEDAIPEDYLRADIVLDIKYTSIVDIHTAEIDKARIREISKALIKYKGLTYEDAVWEIPPTPEDGERWTDFVTAYNDWVHGRYVRLPKPHSLKLRLEKARKEEFAKLEKHKQPETMVGGELMNYQIQGLNWLYYKWFTQENAILADEMGLGKTIQIIGFIANLVQDWNCFPFLIVVPNSTCPNWRREIKRWVPGLRVVAYYGSKESRDLCYKYELFPEGGNSMRCHVVVTSYEAASDESCRRFFRSVNWQGLIVDEGQRLKNDKNILYAALGAMKAPFKVLVTGTPLQNNQRELFNLLHFLDDSFDAAKLEIEYENLDQEKITALHEMIRPFFLRRTKAQVLTFLPPMGQIIIPVSMTIVQKKLYRSILAKNPELMKAIFSSEGQIKASDRGSLSNILMQLRKCLCHPFVYSKGIEDRNVSVAASHRNLVDASSKLQLLELILPKLKERGHRVLIFSQFLDMLDITEDFLDGMQMRYQRLDGSVNALTKQKRIDEFNAPDSPIFAFLLSTRAGGVGINLATADTVIILDPDFNPHQDIQALSRAHRIGQTKKVLCFQLVTRSSSEERIMQIGRRKLALDHVLIREMDAEDADSNDLTSILRHGASEIFEDSGDHDIVYDASNIDSLLDRSHITKPAEGEGQTAETEFSMARVWATDSNAVQNASITFGEDETPPDPGVWESILKERERLAAEGAAAQAEAFGRGRRARTNVDYAGEDGANPVESENVPANNRKPRPDGESDTDFQADDSGEDVNDENEDEPMLDAEDLASVKEPGKREVEQKKAATHKFRRVLVSYNNPSSTTVASTPSQPLETRSLPTSVPVKHERSNRFNCVACKTVHAPGYCPLKLAGVEFCNLCGLAHFGHSRVCPHIQSETQVRAMLEALKSSNEPPHLVSEARRYLRGLKGNLVQLKKQKEAKLAAARESAAAAASAGMGMGMGSAYAAAGHDPGAAYHAQMQMQMHRGLPMQHGQMPPPGMPMGMEYGYGMSLPHAYGPQWNR